MKISRYLATGAVVVLGVDPKTRTIIAHEATGTQTYCEGDVFTSTALPWLTFAARDVFSVIDNVPEDLRGL